MDKIAHQYFDKKIELTKDEYNKMAFLLGRRLESDVDIRMYKAYKLMECFRESMRKLEDAKTKYFSDKDEKITN